MEKIKNVKKIVFPILILIIMIGAIIVATIGFNFGLIYEGHKRIKIYIEKDYSVEDLNNIIKDVLPNEKVLKQDIETFNKDVSFTVKNITAEQKKSLDSKIREKYKIDEKTKDVVVVVSEPHTRLRDIIKPYIKPLVITTIIIFVYILIRFRKLGFLNVTLTSLAPVIIMQALYFSVFAICRIPISKLTMPLSLLVYILTVTSITVYLEKMKKNAE